MIFKVHYRSQMINENSSMNDFPTLKVVISLIYYVIDKSVMFGY